MRLHFDPGLAHQRAAMDAVLGLLEGDGPEPAGACTLPGVVPNPAPLSDAAILANMQTIQAAAGLRRDEALARPVHDRDDSDNADANDAGLEFAIEMETGTGKTYTYLRTLLELARRHALRKWLIIVPSIAIREGVLATLRDTREHFRALLPEVSYRFWAYDGRPLRVRGFATATTPEIGVLTIAAFNKITNRLRQPDERFAGEPPLAWIAAVRPCLVLDEPHHYDSPLSKTSLARLRPRITLRYGATHRSPRALIHRLSAAQAAAQGLVKRVEVATIASNEDETTRISAQIHETVRLHVERQQALGTRGIKVLSLFFVDRVASYTEPDGLVRALFDTHFEALKGGCQALAALPAHQVRAAYFATKKRRGAVGPEAVETSGDSAIDAAAYQLIMRDKARLLSPHEPVAFVFSHSALREGWDNPNIFQVCTLARRHSKIRRRQEIGRGVRLCVDAAGRRVADPAIDVLSVIPAEPYDEFVAGWRREHEDPNEHPHLHAPTPKPVPAGARARAEDPQTDEGQRATPWVELDSEALIAFALGRLGRSDPGHDLDGDAGCEALVVALLGRRRPTIALSPSTIARIVAGAPARARAPSRIADAVAAALADQGG